MIPIKNIHKVVCTYYMLPLEMPFRDSRKGNIVRVRQLIHYLSRVINNEKISLEEIGEYYSYFTKRVYDHNTIRNSVRQVQNRIDTEKGFAYEIDKIKELLSNYNINQLSNFPLEKLKVVDMVINSEDKEQLIILLKSYLKTA